MWDEGGLNVTLIALTGMLYFTLCFQTQDRSPSCPLQGRRSILNIGGDDGVARQRQLRACAHRGVSEGGCAPLRSWKIFEFWKLNGAIWWMLLGNILINSKQINTLQIFTFISKQYVITHLEMLHTPPGLWINQMIQIYSLELWLAFFVMFKACLPSIRYA